MLLRVFCCAFAKRFCCKMYYNSQILFTLLLNFFNKCTLIHKYYSHFSLIFAIICNSCFCKSLLCTPWCAASTIGWRWSFGRSASAAQRKMNWHPNWMSCIACHNFSACERCTLFWAQIFSQPSCTHLYPRMTCLVADISRHSLSPVPCQKSHHCDN